MKQMKKLLSLVAVAALLISILAGCKQQTTVDPIQEVMGYSKNTVFFTLDGKKVTAEDYFFWLARYADYINQMQTMMGAESIDWDEDMGDGTTARDYMKQETLETVKLFWTVEQIAATNKVKLSKEDKDAFAQDREAAIMQAGGQEAYDNYLKSMCLTDKTMEHLNSVSALAVKMEEQFSQEGERFEASKEAIRTFMEEQGILKAKHILFLTTDPNIDGEAYSQSKIAEQKKLAEDVLAQLKSSDDPIALFDELMNQYSEDTGLQGNPDGYLFSTNPDGVDFASKMVKEFEDGTLALGYNEISDLVESQYGYHIILRLDPTDDEETLTKYRQKWAGMQMDTLYQERMDKIEVHTTQAYEDLDTQDFYEKLQAYRASLEAAANEETPSSETDSKKEDESENTPNEENASETENADANANGDEGETSESTAQDENTQNQTTEEGAQEDAQ